MHAVSQIGILNSPAALYRTCCSLPVFNRLSRGPSPVRVRTGALYWSTHNTAAVLLLKMAYWLLAACVLCAVCSCALGDTSERLLMFCLHKTYYPTCQSVTSYRFSSPFSPMLTHFTGINISSASSSVISGQDFLFSCSASPPRNLTDLDVLIDNNVTNSDRLTTISASSSNVDFKFASVTPQDNGLEFACSLDDNGTVYNSENLAMEVICELSVYRMCACSHGRLLKQNTEDNAPDFLSVATA